MSLLRVGVVRGGPSHEYEVSLKSGQAVLEALAEFPEKFLPLDILIDREGQWHLAGRPMAPQRLLPQVDVAFLALHGEYGEDGGVQGLLDQLGVPYTGSGRLASAVAFNKALTRVVVQQAGVRTPRGWVLGPDDDPKEKAGYIFRATAPPFAVKPARAGSSVGVSKVWTSAELQDALERAFAVSSQVVIEEWIEGREATVAVLEGWGGQALSALPEVEIVPPQHHAFFDYEAKYSGETQEICPGNFPKEVKETLARMARTVHSHLDLRHFSRSDFIVHPKRGVFFLEVNTLPGLTAQSLFPKAAAAVGLSFPQLVTHLISLVRAECEGRGRIASVGVV